MVLPDDDDGESVTRKVKLVQAATQVFFTFGSARTTSGRMTLATSRTSKLLIGIYCI